MNPICVTVIIPAYNASATIARALEALSRQNCFQPFEVIVVDDGSSDHTADIVRSFPAVKYIRQENAGPAAARNHGARLALGDFLAFTDADCIPHEDWVSQLMTGFSQPQVGVVAGSYGIANPQSTLARCIAAEICWRHAHLMPDFPKAFGSYNFCARKSVFEAVGGFNTGYRRASGEDNDFSYKVVSAGWQIFFQRKALVDHHHPTRVGKYLREQFQHGFWRVKMYRDHPRMMKGDDYTFWKDIIEIPWVGCIFLAAVVTLVHGAGFGGAGSVTLGLFLFFEILWAFIMTHCFFGGIFFGFILFFRAFARAAGFSTGIIALISRKT